LIVCFFDQEEWGIVGSKYLAMFFEKQTNELGWKIVQCHTLDMAAYDHQNTWTFGLKGPTDDYFAEMYTKASTLCENPMKVVTEDLGRSDYLSFRSTSSPVSLYSNHTLEYWPTTGIGQPFSMKGYGRRIPYPHYHDETDSYDKVDWMYYCASVQLFYIVLHTLLVET
jgi:hypothetical protein